MLKELWVNNSLVEVLEQIPCYEQFIKDLVTKKMTVSFEPPNNMHHCSANTSSYLVENKKDPKLFLLHAL